MDKFPSVDELIKMAKEDPEKLNALQKNESQIKLSQKVFNLKQI